VFSTVGALLFSIKTMLENIKKSGGDQIDKKEK
jgi:hypothetical protein